MLCLSVLQADIARAYRKQARLYHPDKYKVRDAGVSVLEYSCCTLCASTHASRHTCMHTHTHTRAHTHTHASFLCSSLIKTHSSTCMHSSWLPMTQQSQEYLVSFCICFNTYIMLASVFYKQYSRVFTLTLVSCLVNHLATPLTCSQMAITLQATTVKGKEYQVFSLRTLNPQIYSSLRLVLLSVVDNSSVLVHDKTLILLIASTYICMSSIVYVPNCD